MRITSTHGHSNGVKKHSASDRSRLARMSQDRPPMKVVPQAVRNLQLVDEWLGAPAEFRKNAVYACILFADLAGSTEYKLRNKNAVQGMGRVMLHNNIAQGVIEEYKGVVAKRLGDGLLAYFLGDYSRSGTAVSWVRWTLRPLKSW